MGYRGSKSEFNNSVKEQRVDDSLCLFNKHIRYTLMGSEKNYQIKIPSKQLNTNTASRILCFQNKLNPCFAGTGLIDGEGSFSISINKINEFKLGWRVKARFAIGLNIRDLNLLLQLQPSFAGVELVQLVNTKTEKK